MQQQWEHQLELQLHPAPDKSDSRPALLKFARVQLSSHLPALWRGPLSWHWEVHRGEREFYATNNLTALSNQVHYQCQSEPTQTSAPPAPPPWLLDLSATPPPRRLPPPPTATTASRPSTTSSLSTTPTPSPPPARPTKRQYYVLPPESQSKDSEGEEVEEVEAEQQEYLVLGIAVAVSAVATVLTFLLCYQVLCHQIQSTLKCLMFH